MQNKAVDGALFDAADGNGDGLLDREEFVLYRFPESSVAVRKKVATEFLAQHDTDGDGRISGRGV